VRTTSKEFHFTLLKSKGNRLKAFQIFTNEQMISLRTQTGRKIDTDRQTPDRHRHRHTLSHILTHTLSHILTHTLSHILTHTHTHT
jgi:hypothetical protein